MVCSGMLKDDPRCPIMVKRLVDRSCSGAKSVGHCALLIVMLKAIWDEISISSKNSAFSIYLHGDSSAVDLIIGSYEWL